MVRLLLKFEKIMDEKKIIKERSGFGTKGKLTLHLSGISFV